MTDSRFASFRAAFARQGAWVILAAVLLLTSAIRLRLLDVPLERDEGEYAYSGQLILQGIPPYQSAYNMKLPGTYYAYAGLMAVFGQTTRGIHFGLLLVNIACAVFVFLIGRRLLDMMAGLFGALTFALLSLSDSVLGVMAQATHFVILFALAGLTLLLRAREKPRIWELFLSGLLLGASYLMKQAGAFFILFGFLCLITAQADMLRANRRRFVRLLAAFAVGCALPFTLLCLGMVKAGLFARFWFWTVDYARAYGAETPPGEGAQRFWESFSYIISRAPALWFLAAAGLVLLLARLRAQPNAMLAVAFFVFSLAAVSLGLLFRPHYFVLALPAISLLAGHALSLAMILTARLGSPFIVRYSPAIVFVGAALSFLQIGHQYLFQTTPTEASKLMYDLNPFVESLTISKYINTHVPKNARIAVIGSEPEIFFYTHRRSATGYIYFYPLFERQPYAERMQREATREIAAADPEVIVLVSSDTYLQMQPSRHYAVMDWFETNLDRYQAVGVLDLKSQQPTRACWGADPLRSCSPLPPDFMVLYQKK